MLSWLPRSAEYSASARPTSSRSCQRIEPLTCAVSLSSPMIASAVTDLPEPDSPMSPRRSPG